MKNTVIIKGNRYGISIVLNETEEFPKLLNDLAEKLEGAEEFFDSDKQLAVTFEGRTLSNMELDQVLTIIKENSKLNIQYVMDENSDLEATFFDIIQSDAETKAERELADHIISEVESDYESTEETEPSINNEEIQQKDNAGMFYKGTLRSGQTLEAKESLIIIGDVNPGATVAAGGNIIIIGALKGNAIAGSNNNRKAFVMALSMNPIQIQIADVIARSPDSKKIPKRKQESMIATIVDNQICLDTVSKNAFQEINF